MKQTGTGKAMAPVVDIFPQLCIGYHDRERVAGEMALLRSLGFERVYFVVCNPGYPQFSNPWLCLMPPGKAENHGVESILNLGDPNWVYLEQCHRQGMEAYAIIKPYEAGGGSTVPHGARTPYDTGRVETVGGDRIHFDNLLRKRPELRVMRKPVDPELVNQPVTAIELIFMADAFTQRTGPRSAMEYPGPEDPEAAAGLRLFVSGDNGSYREVEGSLEITWDTQERTVTDANGQPVFDAPRRCRVARISGFSFPSESRYFAVSVDSAQDLWTLPQSMIRLMGPGGEIPSTVSPYVRTPADADETDPARRLWGVEQQPRHQFDTADAAAAAFADAGFEFEWHGSGFWGRGFKACKAYGIGRGKLPYMKGTPCEGYPEVRDFWLDQVRTLVSMGYDGVDIRLQNHSGMVSDYMAYGYNEPIRERYLRQYGVDIGREDADPMKIMQVRGSFFMEFLEQASDLIHSSGKRLQVHLRHAHEQPRLSAEFNELGFWAMPKIALDWRRAVDLADEITLKHYYHNEYRPEWAAGIKQYARSRGKRVWVHCYIAQGPELNPQFFEAVDADPQIGGILLYEVCHSSRNEVNPGIIEQYGVLGINPVTEGLIRALMDRFGQGIPPRGRPPG